MKISGAFVYQPPSAEGVFTTPGGFMIALTVFDDDGSIMFADNRNIPLPPPPDGPSLTAAVVLSYPQLPQQPELDITHLVSGGEGYVQATATLQNPPPGGWIPAALLIYVNDSPEQIITAAAPAVADSGIEGVLFESGRGLAGP
jgi:hypothetical protein